MTLLHTTFITIGRIGIGAMFFFSVIVDLKTRTQIFSLMQQKKVPTPWLFYLGAIAWKTITSIAILCNIYTFWAALALAVYVFIANMIFNNFWAVSKQQRGFSSALFVTHMATAFGLLLISGTAHI